MEKQDFIITSLQPWDIEIGSTIKNTALEISKENRVLYVSTPLDVAITCAHYYTKTHRPLPPSHGSVAEEKHLHCRQINENMMGARLSFYTVNPSVSSQLRYSIFLIARIIKNWVGG